MVECYRRGRRKLDEKGGKMDKEEEVEVPEKNQRFSDFMASFILLSLNFTFLHYDSH